LAEIGSTILGVMAAFLAAMFFALGSVYARRGMETGNPRMAHRVSLIINLVILWPAALVYMLLLSSDVSLTAVFYFVLAGLAGSGLGRLFSFIGIERIGVSESSPIASLSPLFTTIMGVAILGERIKLGIAFGTGLVVLGLALLSRQKTSRYRWIGILITLLSAFFFALSDLLRKVGLIYTNNPPLGAALGSTAALLMFYSYGSAKPGSALISKSGMSRDFVMSGVTTALALLMTFFAFSLTQLIVSAPLIRTNPLFALFFTYIMLRGIERLRVRTIISAVIIVAGIIAIIMG